MTHEEIEKMLEREVRRREQEDLRHFASLGGVDPDRLARWSRRASVRRYIVAACLVVATWTVTTKVVAQTQPGQVVAEDGGKRYNYIVSQGDPERAYDTLQSTLRHL